MSKMKITLKVFFNKNSLLFLFYKFENLKIFIRKKKGFLILFTLNFKPANYEVIATKNVKI